MRILCLNYEYPPVGGGGGRIAHRINAGLVRRGHSVRVHTAGLKHLPDHEIVDGVEVFRTRSFRRKEDTCTVPEMGLYVVTNVLPTIGHIRRWKPDVIHAHFAVPTGAVAWSASLVTGAPYVLTAHLGDVPGGVPEQTAGLFKVVEPFTRPIWNRARALTAVSTFVADLAEKAYHRRPLVIPNGIPLGDRPVLESHSPPRILMVGRLSVQKNPMLAVRSLAMVKDLAWEFHVIGDGPLRHEMETGAAQQGIGDRTRFHGWLPGDDVARMMRESDLLLLTSRSEGLPVAAIEALSHGLGIVSTDIPGVADVVGNHKNGRLAPPTPDALGAALRQPFCEPETLSQWRNHSLDLAANFDLEKILSAYEDILTSSARTTN